MNIEYTWKITGLKKALILNELEDVITSINFEYTGKDSESKEFFTFLGVVPVAEPSEDNFKSIDKLTQEEVIEWAKANHPVDHMNEIIEKGILNKLSPIKEVVEDVKWL
jgi:hypothetical protein